MRCLGWILHLRIAGCNGIIFAGKHYSALVKVAGAIPDLNGQRIVALHTNPVHFLPPLSLDFLPQQCRVHSVLIKILVLLLYSVSGMIRNLSGAGKKNGWGSTSGGFSCTSCWMCLPLPCSLTPAMYLHTCFAGILSSAECLCLCLPWKLALMFFLHFLPSYTERHLPAQLSCFSPWAIAVSPVMLQVCNQSCWRESEQQSELSCAAIMLCPNEVFDAMPWSFQSFFFPS